jgi:hypothetical protein
MARAFKSWLEAYMEYTKASESPDECHYWTGVATLAGALRRNVWLDQKIFVWSPNFYIILVGPPGIVAKSTTLSLGMRLLEKVPEIHFGPESATWQSLLPAFQDAVMTLKWTDNGEDHTLPISPLTIPVSELGTFLKIKDDDFVSFLINLWDGRASKRAFSHRTLTRGSVDVQNPWINIIGCTTPAWLAANAPEHLIGGGLMSRILFVYAQRKRKLVAYPSQEWVGQDFVELERKLVEDLTEISKLKGPFVMTSDAYKYGKEWYENLWTSAPLHMVSSRFEGYRARKQTHLHKLAMILAISSSNDLVIHDHHLQAADILLTSTEKSMVTVFDSVGTNIQSRYTKELLGLAQGLAAALPGGLVPITELYTRLYNNMSLDDFKKALASGTEANLFRVIDSGQKDPKGKTIWALTFK